jgi:hypothetical protein
LDTGLSARIGEELGVGELRRFQIENPDVVVLLRAEIQSVGVDSVLTACIGSAEFSIT